MSGHTPGPWEADFEANTNCIEIFHPYMGGRTAICGVMNEAQDDSTDEDRANANLIAAAPELLEALIALYDRRNEGTMAQARTAIAIAKATP